MRLEEMRSRSGKTTLGDVAVHRRQLIFKETAKLEPCDVRKSAREERVQDRDQ